MLVVGRRGPVAARADAEQPATEPARGRHAPSGLGRIGTGEWDAQRRPSVVRADRVLRIAPSQVRRIGAQLDERVDRGSASTALA